MALRYHVISWHHYVDIDNSKDRERVDEIAKTSDSIKNTLLWRLVKWRSTSLWRDTLNLLSTSINRLSKISLTPPRILSWLTFFSREEEKPKLKRPSALYGNPIQTSTPVKLVLNQSKTVPSTLNEVSEIIEPRDLSYDHTPSVEKIFEIADELFVTSISHLLQTFEGNVACEL